MAGEKFLKVNTTGNIEENISTQVGGAITINVSSGDSPTVRNGSNTH